MTAGDGRPRVSLNLIARDEEANLGPCLGPVRVLVDEVVVVDTGSKDRTREVARSLGAGVVEFPWRDDFAAARNCALDHSTGDYVLWLDADDRIDPPNRERLAAVLGALGGPPAAYLTRYRSQHADDPGATSVTPRIQLFPRRPGVRWKYRAHPEVGWSLRDAGVPVRWTAVVVEHTGLEDPAVRARKLERYLRTSALALAEYPDDPYPMFNLGAAYLAAGRTEEAVALLTKVVAACPGGRGVLAPAYTRLAEGLRRLGDRTGALRACAEGLARCPDDRDLRHSRGVLLSEAGDWAGAASEFERLVATGGPGGDDWGDFARAGHNLALAYAKLGRPDAAAGLWGRVLAREPGYRAAWVGLGELGVARGDWPTAARAADELARLGDDLAAAVLRARSHLGRRELDAARKELAEGLRRHPSDLRLRLLRSHLCLAEGRDWVEAEAALVAVLEVAPGHPEALRNLATVRGLMAEGRW